MSAGKTGQSTEPSAEFYAQVAKSLADLEADQKAIADGELDFPPEHREAYRAGLAMEATRIGIPQLLVDCYMQLKFLVKAIDDGLPLEGRLARAREAIRGHKEGMDRHRARRAELRAARKAGSNDQR